MAHEDSEDIWSNRRRPIVEDMGFQRAEWIFERTAWCALGGIILLALLGLFSVGSLSSIRLGDPGAQLQMDFQRFHRDGALTDMTLFLLPGHAPTAAPDFNTSFIEAFTIEDVRPPPVVSHSSPDGIKFVFDASQSELMPIYFSLRPRGAGLVATRISLNDHDPIAFTLFIYP